MGSIGGRTLGNPQKACDAQYFRSNVIDFDTPWCEPMPVIEALAKRFPGHAMIVLSTTWTAASMSMKPMFSTTDQ
jgi:hypothetical protein